MARVFLGLGSSTGDGIAVLKAAIREIRTLGGVEVAEVSPAYRTEPWAEPPAGGRDDTTWFVNCVVEVRTALSPPDLLAGLQDVEARLGRVRGQGTPEQRRFEPRTIDIDILLHGDTVVSGAGDLHIPHLLMHERAFVLRPLADVAPDVEHPVLYRTVTGMLQALDDEHGVQPLALPPRWFEEPADNPSRSLGAGAHTGPDRDTRATRPDGATA